MTIERYVEQIPQTTDAVPQQLPIERGPGNFLLFQSSLANVTITLMFDGVREVFANVNGGIYVRRVKPWANLRIDGVIGTQVTYFIGTENVDRDETDIRQQVAVLAGVSATADQPAASITDTANVAVPNAALTQIVPQNFNRRRVAISFPSNSAIGANTTFFRKATGVNNVLEVQAGVIYNFSGSYAVSVRNDSGGALTALVMEEI
jgi:hypothetical protein